MVWQYADWLFYNRRRKAKSKAFVGTGKGEKEMSKFYEEWEKVFEKVPVGLKISIGKLANTNDKSNSFFELINFYQGAVSSYEVFRKKQTNEYITRYVCISNRSKAFVDYFFVKRLLAQGEKEKK